MSIFDKIKSRIFGDKDDDAEKVHKPDYIVRLRNDKGNVYTESVYDVALKRNWSQKEISEAEIEKFDGKFDVFSVLNWNMETRQDWMRTRQVSDNVIVAYLCDARRE